MAKEVQMRDYSSYGLDITTTNGGCGSFVGLCMQHAGLPTDFLTASFVDKTYPDVPLYRTDPATGYNDYPG